MNVITEAFVDAFERQCDLLGYSGATVAVSHPIQPLTTAEIGQLAGTAFPAIMAAVRQRGR